MPPHALGSSKINDVDWSIGSRDQASTHRLVDDLTPSMTHGNGENLSKSELRMIDRL